MQPYSATTQGITVEVEPIYLPEQSEPALGHYLWAYRVRITNTSAATVQLRERYWRITDAHGLVQEVRGEGVVGEQPVLASGQSFEYTSGTTLGTPSGIMVGHYTMYPQDETTPPFNVAIPAFSLDADSRNLTHH